MSEPLLWQLAGRLACPVGESERKRARLHLLDWLACVAGARLVELGGAWPPASGIAAKGGTAIERAALLGNVLEMDDVHRTGRLHPGPVVWPAALARHDRFIDVLDAAVRGYEAMIAVGETFDERHYAFYHNTATAGVFGAAAAASAPEDFAREPNSIASALAFAGSVTGGLWQMRHEAGAGKQWHIHHAVETGQRAADFARAGFAGPARLLEGPQGLYAATCTVPSALRLEGGWKIHEVSFKPWAACRHAHPAIDAAMELRARGKLEPPFVVETYADALAFCDRPDPRSENEAKFSLQHAVAIVADGRLAEPNDFSEQAIAELAPLRALASVAEDPAITARYPAHFGARVNGLELADTRGDPERPIDESAIVAKMCSLAQWGGLASAEADRACELALRGEDAEAIGALLEEWLA